MNGGEDDKNEEFEFDMVTVVVVFKEGRTRMVLVMVATVDVVLVRVCCENEEDMAVLLVFLLPLLPLLPPMLAVVVVEAVWEQFEQVRGEEGEGSKANEMEVVMLVVGSYSVGVCATAALVQPSPVATVTFHRYESKPPFPILSVRRASGSSPRNQSSPMKELRMDTPPMSSSSVRKAQCWDPGSPASSLPPAISPKSISPLQVNNSPSACLLTSSLVSCQKPSPSGAGWNIHLAASLSPCWVYTRPGDALRCQSCHGSPMLTMA